VFEDFGEVDAIDEFRSEILCASMLEAVIDTDDIRMMQLRSGDGLAFETRFEFGVSCEFGMNPLEHRWSIETCLAREDDDAHAATPKLAFDRETAESPSNEG
jgi:hypothetical protein